MTFIATFVGESFTGLSDVVVSASAIHGFEPVKFFPLHNFGPEGSPNTTVSFDQKSIIIDPQTLILLSGRQDTCRKFLEFIIDDLRVRADFDFIRSCKDFNEGVENIDEEHFIFHKISFFDKQKNITGCHSMSWNVFQLEDLDYHAYVAGSGAEDLSLINIDRTLEGFDARVTPWLTRLILALGQELCDADPLSKGYGGWYEIITGENGEFQKMPYTVICWRALANGEIELVGPIAGSEYQGYNLGIGRINFDNGHLNSSYTWVGDPLGRDAPKSIKPSVLTIFNTPMHIHLIFRDDGIVSSHTVYKNDKLTEISANYDNGNLNISYSRELYQSIRKSAHLKITPIAKLS